jgi:Single-strand binding protein family
MPLILIAGTVAAQPKALDFPANGRPRCEVRVKVEDDNSVMLYRVLGFDDQTAELETLLPGDSVAIQGRLVVETRDGRRISID